MEVKQCKNGHFYESTLPNCPVCEQEAKNSNSDMISGGNVNDYGATEPLIFPGVEDYRPTSPIEINANPGEKIESNSGKTKPPRNYGVTPPEHYGVTTPIGVSFDKGVHMNTKPAYMNDQAGFLPVVGWLVCIEGSEKGQDYRIHAGYNSIGRDSSMDIVFKYDENVSREKDCYIGYDQQEKEFFFGHDNGRNIIRVNGKRVNGSTDLNTYDILSIGSCKYMFVALCGEQFDWSDH